MKVISVSDETNKSRAKFFHDIFRDGSGYVCLAVRSGKSFREEFFKYPDQFGLALEFVNRNYHGGNVYFCPQFLREPKRVKASVSSCPVVWADLDECDPAYLDPKPSLVLQTSPGRYQGFWFLDKPADPVEGEDASHRLAHKYQALGVDQSGWDLTQLLRVPLTYNQKYSSTMGAPVVELDSDLGTGTPYSLEVFQALPQVPGYEWVDEPLPETKGIDADNVLFQYRDRLDPQVHVLYAMTPRADWSGSLWNLECLLLEAGVPKPEAYIVCRESACNKFRRDGLDEHYLWKDVCRAAARVHARVIEVTQITPLPELLTEAEHEHLRALPDTFVERYIAWAKSRGDAAWQYHEAGAFIILSQLLSGAVKLSTSFGVIVPNLWFMILADTTLTRKSTAMDMAVEMLLQVDPDAVLATDGSLEGLMTGISLRPNRPGIFWRDEFSGLLEMIKKKDYYAGMIESLTKLYDGKYQKRMLRKEIIEVRDPILLIFCGGIRTRVLAQMDIEYVISGFMPRFIFIEAASNMENFRPIGPLTESQDAVREKLLQELVHLKDLYTAEMIVHIGEQTVSTKQVFEPILTPEVWDRYNEFEKVMINYGIESGKPEVYTPVLDRLSKSGLKAAMLLAASRQNPANGVKVEMQDLLRAISYVETWRTHSIDVASNVGKTGPEKQLDLILAAIYREPGLGRGKLMQNYHLTAREADWILETLDQRGLVRRVKSGRTERLFPTLLR